MPTPKTYWFPAKRHGWGWGWPRAWQGRLVLAGFYALVLGGAVLLLPGRGPAYFVGWCALLCLLLVAVCWWKGEPPGWRDGDRR